MYLMYFKREFAAKRQKDGLEAGSVEVFIGYGRTIIEKRNSEINYRIGSQYAGGSSEKYLIDGYRFKAVIVIARQVV